MLVVSGLASDNDKEHQREGHGNHAKHKRRCDHNLLNTCGVRTFFQGKMRRMRMMKKGEERETWKNTGLLS